MTGTGAGTGRTLRCPNCDGKMRDVERRGVVIDICTECRGVFLDRGELDALVEAIEQVDELYSREQVPPAAPAAAGYQAPQAPPGSPSSGKKDVVAEAMDLFQAVARERKHKGHSSHHGGHKKHKRGGLADFFDF